jgi:predicted metalloprotease with PDZ domain
LADGVAEAKLAHVYDGGAARHSGLATGDIIVAVDGLRTTRANLDSLLAGYGAGEVVKIHVFRRDELMEFRVILQAPPIDTCVLTLMEDIDGAVRVRRTSWLGNV